MSPDPCSLCPLSSTEFVEPPTPPKKIPGYATGSARDFFCNLCSVLHYCTLGGFKFFES